MREREANGWTDDFEGMLRRLWADQHNHEAQEESLAQLKQRGLQAMFRLLKTYPGQNLLIASHGTAMSVLVHHFRPSFGVSDFLAIKDKMPWLLRFSFVSQNLIALDEIDLV